MKKEAEKANDVKKNDSESKKEDAEKKQENKEKEIHDTVKETQTKEDDVPEYMKKYKLETTPGTKEYEERQKQIKLEEIKKE